MFATWQSEALSVRQTASAAAVQVAWWGPVPTPTMLNPILVTVTASVKEPMM